MIRTILVPTDFSTCARNALMVGAQLSRRFSATLRMLYCADLPSGWHKMGEKERALNSGNMEEYRRAQVLMQELREQVPGVQVLQEIRGGRLVDAVGECVHDFGVDLIVMGSHGASGKSEYFIGSNTQKVVRTVHRPVLVVKEPMEELRFEKVIFASNFNKEEEGAFLRFKEIVKHFVPEIHLLMVDTASIFEPSTEKGKEAMEYFLSLCSPLKGFSHLYREFNVDQGIRSFSRELGASLIGISNHQKRPLARMLAGSNVEALINHSALPVLSIDYED